MPAFADRGLKAECDRCGVVPNANQNCTRSALTVQQLIANVMCAGFESHHDGFLCFAPEPLDRTEGFDPALVRDARSD